MEKDTLQKDLNIILIKCALTELLYIGHIYETEIGDSRHEWEKYQDLFDNYYDAKESNWKEEVRLYIIYIRMLKCFVEMLKIIKMKKRKIYNVFKYSSVLILC